MNIIVIISTTKNRGKTYMKVGPLRVLYLSQNRLLSKEFISGEIFYDLPSLKNKSMEFPSPSDLHVRKKKNKKDKEIYQQPDIIN